MSFTWFSSRPESCVVRTLFLSPWSNVAVYRTSSVQTANLATLTPSPPPTRGKKIRLQNKQTTNGLHVLLSKNVLPRLQNRYIPETRVWPSWGLTGHSAAYRWCASANGCRTRCWCARSAITDQKKAFRESFSITPANFRISCKSQVSIQSPILIRPSFYGRHIT